MSDDTERRSASSLAAFTIPQLTFSGHERLRGTLRPIWETLARRDYRRACESGLQALSATSSGSVEERAALYLAIAAAAFGAGNRRRALTAAQESVTIVSRQWAAHRILMQVYWSERDYENAYFYLSTLPDPGTSFDWDEPLTHIDRHLSIGALAWRLQDWDGVSDHLKRAYPEGMASMPLTLREDFFRASLYRESASDAANAAGALLCEYGIEEIDQMLGTMDARGWSVEALDLYRTAFQLHSGHPLLRRRLVGLCIRQGEIEEARKLTAGSALDMAA